MKVNWFGDDVLKKIKEYQAKNLTRAAIHLSRRIKENLSVSGRQTGVEEAEVNKDKVVRTGFDERGRRSVTVGQEEFHRIADARNAARIARAEKKAERNKLGNKIRRAFKSDTQSVKKTLSKFRKKFFPKKRRRRK